MYSHINLLCCLSQPHFTYIWKNSHLIHFIISIKRTFHTWQCKKHTRFLLSLYCCKQNLLTWRANLGSSWISPKPFKHGGQDGMDEMEPVAWCAMNLWVELGQRGFDNHLLNMPKTSVCGQPEMEASSVMNSIITQIWHQGINPGHQNQTDYPSCQLQLWYIAWSLPRQFWLWPVNLPCTLKRRREGASTFPRIK